MEDHVPVEDGWDDEVPPLDAYESLFEDVIDGPEPAPVYDDTDIAPPAPDTDAAPRVMDEIRRIIAAHHGRSLAELADIVSQIDAAEPVIGQLEDTEAETLTAVLEVLRDTTTATVGGAADLTYVPLAGLYNRPVQAEFERIAALAGNSDGTDPALTWQALRERVQRDLATRSALRYISAIRDRQPVERLVTLYEKLEAPTTRRAATREAAAKTAAEIAAAHAAANGSRTKLRISSGWPTADLTFTSRLGKSLTEPLGFIGPGEGFVVAGPTGTGKSSWTYGFIGSAVQDIINQGKPWAKVLFAHTEEESIDKIKACGMLPGQSLHHLADNLIVAAIGTSRQQLMMAIYDNVAEAALRSKETGLPIDEFLIRLIVLDYIQSLVDPGHNMTDETAKTAELLLRGIQAWNPVEMERWSGLSYRAYTGQPWPSGMEQHRVAGVYMAQLVKQDDSSLLYRAGDKKCQLSDFALEASSPDGAWKGPDGNYYAWEVKEGDLRLFKQNAIRGSGVILQNATAIIILHRSQAYNNPAKPGLGPDGRPHLTDTRGRFLLDKMRTGGNLAYIPMSFDLDADGFRARYIDEAALQRHASGTLRVDDVFQRAGDPMVPIRRRRSALEELVY